jgi:hypothetical protein
MLAVPPAKLTAVDCALSPRDATGCNLRPAGVARRPPTVALIRRAKGAHTRLFALKVRAKRSNVLLD